MNLYWDRISIWLATGLGVGLVSPAAGTVGGLWGFPLAWAIGNLSSLQAQLAWIFLIGLLSLAVCSRAARLLSGKDPQAIALDEIAVLPIVYLGIEEKSTSMWIIGWVLFRVFDIIKPPPVRQLERLPGGWGIMADDVAAAGYACLALHAIIWTTT